METQTLISELLGTPYVYWNGNSWSRQHIEPFYSINNREIDIDYVKSKGCNCAGFMNLLLRNKGISIPDYNSDYPGGTFAYGIHFKWERIDETKNYPKYSLFLRPYIENSDEGHIGIIDDEGTIYDCYPNYGVRRYTNWRNNFMFEFVCTELCEKLSE